MLLYWQFNTEPKRGKQNFVYPRRRAPHVESLVAATLQQSAQRPIFNTEEYRQKSIKSHLPQSKHSTSHRHSVTQPTPKNTKTSQQGHTSPQPGTLKKSPRGVQRGRGFAAPLRFSFSQKNTVPRSPKKANDTQYFKKSISKILLLYLTTRTLYIPSISLSSSSALAEAALSRSIRV